MRIGSIIKLYEFNILLYVVFEIQNYYFCLNILNVIANGF